MVLVVNPAGTQIFDANPEAILKAAPIAKQTTKAPIAG